jgi:flavin-dependent dehydrogenase
VTTVSVPLDVAIVGASLAGSSAAIRLAQAGISVALIDKSDFPRSKACGEGFSRRSFEYLQTLGINVSALIDDTTAFNGYRLVSIKAPHHTCVASATTPKGWGIPRNDLDAALLAAAAKQPTVQLLLHHTVRSVRREAQAWTITCNSASLSARYLFLATGAATDNLAREYVTSTTQPSDRIGYTLHGELASGSLPNVVTILPASHGEIYVTRVGAKQINLSLVGSVEFVQKHRDADYLESILHSSLGIQIHYKPDSSSYGASHFQQRRKSKLSTLYLLGDAVESFDPACGLGMSHALYTGIAAADSAIESLERGASTAAALEEYLRKQAHFARGVRHFSRLVRLLLRLHHHAPALFTAISGRIAGQLMDAFERLTSPTSSLLSRPNKFA